MEYALYQRELEELPEALVEIEEDRRVLIFGGKSMMKEKKRYR